MKRNQHRPGAIIVLTAFMMIFLFGFMAFAIDVGYILNMRTDIQASVDSAALAGAGALGYGDAVVTARHYATLNDVTGKVIEPGDLTVELGRWDEAGRIFQNGATPCTAVRVAAQSGSRGLFFGSVLGTSLAGVQAESTAVMQPRDIMLVLDYSGSMRGEKIDALRNAVDVFISAIQSTDANDQVGFSWYNENGALAQPLTFNLGSVRSAVHTREVGGYTNIGEGMEIGRRELSNARPGAMRMMVLMTDGLANRPLYRDPQRYVRDEADLAALEGFPIVTISFGSGADRLLMEHVADETDGVHFHVNGTSPSEREELKEVFLKVAARRPSQLVD